MYRLNLFIVGFFIVMAAAPTAIAAPDMSRAEVAAILKKNSKLSDEQVSQLVEKLATQLDSKPGERIPIRGVLYAHGINGALFRDTDEWYMDATIVDPVTGDLIEVDNLFTVDFHNGGLKFEFAYKWMFTFVPSEMSLQQLDGGIYGRGLGATMEALIGLEGAWMPGENRPGHLFHAALKAGLGAGLNFPKMEFKLRRVR